MSDAARHACNKVVGVDCSEDLCKQDRINSERLRGRKAPVVVHNGIAEEFDYTQATVCSSSIPLAPQTLDAVLHKINHDTRRNDVRFAFVNPSADHDEVFAQHTWLEQYDYLNAERGVGQSVAVDWASTISTDLQILNPDVRLFPGGASSID